jgi:hypothetical protein
MRGYNGYMTNTTDIKKLIDQRIKSRDIEKMFDDFLERVTDTVIDDIPFPHDNEDDALELIDYIIDTMWKEFNLRYIEGA